MNKRSSGNILLVANWESDVGYAWWLMESFWLSISDYYRQHNLDSVLIYPKITTIPEHIDQSCITVLEHDFHDTSFTNIFKLRRLIKTHNIKTLYLSDAKHFSWIYLLLKSWGISNIIVHEHGPGERTLPGLVKKLVRKFLFSIPHYSADKFYAVSDFVKNRLIHASCVPRQKCACISNGIIPIKIDKTENQYAQNLFNIAPDKIIIVTTGRATYYKGIDFFIECANKLINEYNKTQFHFLYCGDGPDLGNFKALVHQYKLENNFTFAGRRNDVRQILPSCHIGLHAATGEVGYSLSILEYMSAGLLTIIPNNPSVSGATINNVTGLLYKERDIDTCLDKILQYHDQNTSDNISKNAIQSVNEKYNLQHTHELLIDNIKSLI